MPKGINIPNYNDIRTKEGFKNVVFESNNKPNRSKWELLEFVKDKSESNFIHEHSKAAYQVQVAGHELFGHGSGKEIYRDEKTGKCPISLADPLKPSEKISSCYEKGESYGSKFGDFSSSYEECRADLSGLYLGLYPEMYKTFNWTVLNNTDQLWLSLLQEARKGILGMQSSFNEESQKWK